MPCVSLRRVENEPVLSDRERWNARYRERPKRSVCADIVRDWAGEGPGRALDLACGDGGNCELLAGRGFEVEAVDISEVALARLAGRAHIHPICADLDLWRPPPACYRLAIMIMFFDRRLLAPLADSVVGGGRLIVQCFTEAPDGSLAIPSNPDYASRRGELIEALPGRVLHHRILERPRQGSASAWIERLVVER